jgi:nitroreductase
MEFRDVVEERVSVRQFRKDPVSPADVREMVRLASLVPSPNNQQPWRFMAVTRSSLLPDMAKAVHARVRAMLPEPGSDDARRATGGVVFDLLRGSTAGRCGHAAALHDGHPTGRDAPVHRLSAVAAANSAILAGVCLLGLSVQIDSAASNSRVIIG